MLRRVVTGCDWLGEFCNQIGHVALAAFSTYLDTRGSFCDKDLKAFVAKCSYMAVGVLGWKGVE